MKLTVKQVREAVKQLRGVAIEGDIKLPLRDDIALTVGGAIIIPGFGYMHPETFRDMVGEEVYQVVIRRPRVICEYDGCTCNSCSRDEE